MRTLLLLALSCGLPAPLLAAGSVDEAIASVRHASPTTAASSEIQSAWRVLAAAEANDMTTILRGMNESNPAVENWLRTAVDNIATRTLAAGGELPQSQLMQLLTDIDSAPRARRTAYEWLERVDPESTHALLAGMIHDPSLELRYDAVAAGMALAKAASGDEAVAQYEVLLNAARDLHQMKQCKAALDKAGKPVDLGKHLGFIRSWRAIGVFDNSGKDKFKVAYPPEDEVDFDATYAGKTGDVRWREEPLTTNNDMGLLDLNEAIGPEKGAAVYLYAEVEVADDHVAQVRYSTSNGTRVWVNGELVASSEVYHAGGAADQGSGGIDQYIADTKLKAGKNTLLLKVCQNEQKESWAQVWTIQCRLAEPLGGGIPFELVGEQHP